MIVEYESKYLDDIKDLLVELEEYIISVDQDNLDLMSEDYREKYAINDLKLINENNGKCYLYLENGKVVGLIMGIVTHYEDADYLDYKCPKKGDIIELIVSQTVRSNGIGKKLMEKMEQYFKSIGCEYIKVSVFAYNSNAINFYSKEGYHSRMIDMIKKI